MSYTATINNLEISSKLNFMVWWKWVFSKLVYLDISTTALDDITNIRRRNLLNVWSVFEDKLYGIIFQIFRHIGCPDLTCISTTITYFESYQQGRRLKNSSLCDLILNEEEMKFYDMTWIKGFTISLIMNFDFPINPTSMR